MSYSQRFALRACIFVGPDVACLQEAFLPRKKTFRRWLPQELAKLDQDERKILSTLLSERYERKSVMISTNLVFSEWIRIFKSPMTTMATIDRVVRHSASLDLMVMERYWAKEATITKQQARTLMQDETSGTTLNEQENSPVTSGNGTH